MRYLVLVGIAVVLPMPSLAQTAPPPWPQLKLDSCPVISQLRDASKRAWKHGEAEQDEFWTGIKATDPQKNAELLSKFLEKYPDSDYREPALFAEWVSYVELKDVTGQLQVSEMLVVSPEGEPLTRTAGFVTLDSVLSAYVGTDDPQKDRKLADLARWTECGSAAAGMQERPPNVPEDAFQKKRRYEDSVFDRTAGFIAYMRNDYALANAKLETASKLNPQDSLAYLWLATTKFFLPAPDSNSGIFYYARAASLAPPAARERFKSSVKEIYVLVHGSEKGLPDLLRLAESNQVPPPNFNVLTKAKTKHHYGTAIAATAVVGLLLYAAATHPDWSEGIAQGFGGTQEHKLMIFGGPDHRTYLGCLSCEETAPDSVLNEFGQYGSPYRPESIWNRSTQFGSASSPYSVCNQFATNPPVIVDQQGTAYGRLTLNQSSQKIGAGMQFSDWLVSSVCQ